MNIYEAYVKYGSYAATAKNLNISKKEVKKQLFLQGYMTFGTEN